MPNAPRLSDPPESSHSAEESRAKSLTADHGCRPQHAAFLADEFCPDCEANLYERVPHHPWCRLTPDERASVDARVPVKPEPPPYVPPKARKRTRTPRKAGAEVKPAPKPIRCMVCGHAHGGQGNCITAMAFVCASNRGRCLDPSCKQCERWAAHQAPQSA